MDLNTPEARGKSLDARFMERALTDRERRAIERSTSPDRLLWAFWAARETAYKAISKIHPKISSAPRRYRAQLAHDAESGHLLNPAPGVVDTPEGPVPVRVMFHPDYVHCIGGFTRSGNPESLKWGVGIIDAPSESGGRTSLSELESCAARHLAAIRIAGILHCHPQDVVISGQSHQSKPSPPKLYIKGKPTGLDISLSHDGRFAAFAVTGF